MSDATSLSLLQQVQQRQGHAWDRFDVSYRQFIERILCRRGLDVHDAADVCQEVMLVVHRELPRFEHNGRIGSFRNWLRKVTVTQLALLARRSRRHRTHRLRIEDIEHELSQPDSELCRLWNREHDRALVELLLDSLAAEVGERPMLIFRRTFLEGVPPQQVADELGMTKNAVIVTKSKMLKRAKDLKELLSD